MVARIAKTEDPDHEELSPAEQSLQKKMATLRSKREKLVQLKATLKPTETAATAAVNLKKLPVKRPLALRPSNQSTKPMSPTEAAKILKLAGGVKVHGKENGARQSGFKSSSSRKRKLDPSAANAENC